VGGVSIHGAEIAGFGGLLKLVDMDRVALRNLGVSEFIIRHLEKHDLGSPLGFRCQPPLYWESSPIAKRGFIPLWECGTMLWYFNPQTKTFENCSLEDIDDVRHKYVSLQSVLAELVLELYEDETEIGELRGLAESAGFRHVDRLLAEAEKNRDSYREWRDGFPATCS
jgi:hypothetical protein